MKKITSAFLALALAVSLFAPAAVADQINESKNGSVILLSDTGDGSSSTDPIEPPPDPPATNPPATEPPATNPPATEPPATEPPATEPPVTEPPTEPVIVELTKAHTPSQPSASLAVSSVKSASR